MEKRKRGRPFGTYKGAYPTKNNGRRTRLYVKWCSMIARCHGVHPSRSHYEIKGIKVCDRWRGVGGFQNFVLDMGECPEGLTLERINNAVGYEPLNCRWATWKEQAQNRDRSGRLPDPNSLKQKAKAAGLPYLQVYLRIKRLGWTEVKALSTPMRSWNKR